MSALNGQITTHNSNVATFEVNYAAATTGNVTTADAATTAASLASTRLSLACEAVDLVNAKAALRVNLRADLAAAPAPAQTSLAAFGPACLNEATGDNDELQQTTTGLGMAMAAAI